ncbi:L-2-amino-thiazoline-4-carboxylic acid hydrolase [Actinosynnema sp. NPDC050436]|uniref:L-2-amino-thiazoline-4-carboxylic acid hydrolase n=1 Tax=Actinosynnema sp. NPDC050436 TaxID=3155659 RepID=UPI0033C5BEE0
MRDFGADGVCRSRDDSPARLGPDRVDVALLHDVDLRPGERDRAAREGLPAVLLALTRRWSGPARRRRCGPTRRTWRSRCPPRSGTTSPPRGCCDREPADPRPARGVRSWVVSETLVGARLVVERAGRPARARVRTEKDTTTVNDHIIELFRAHLADHVPAAEVDAGVARAVAEAGPRVGCDSPHLPLTATVVAGYRALLDRMPREEALSLVAQAFHEPLRPYVHDTTKAALDASDDPFRTITDVSKDREVTYFGADFAFARSEDADSYLLDVTRCFYVAVLAACGVPELGPVFCRFDAAWIGAIDRDRHGVDFTRPTTIALGGTTCPFHFRRADRVPPA